jgi:hypothetical protein
MKPGILVITGDNARYGSGHETRMHQVALALKKRKIEVQKVCIEHGEILATPLPCSLVILDRRDTGFNPPLADLPVLKIAVDNRGQGRDQAHHAIDLLPHLSMNRQEYSAALKHVILPSWVTETPARSAGARITLHSTREEAAAAADFIPGPNRLPEREFIGQLRRVKKPALYFGQALFEAVYLGLDVQLYPVSEYHKKLAVDLFSRYLIEPDLLAAVDGSGLNWFVDQVQQAWKG